MDNKFEIKDEPVWLEGAASTSFDNNDLVSQKTHLKEETKTELAVPEQIQVNTFQPFTDIKDEIFIKEPTVGQMDPCFKEDDNMENVGEGKRDPVDSLDSCCNVLEMGSEVMGNFQSDDGERPNRCNVNNHFLSPATKNPFHLEQYNTTIETNVSSISKSHAEDLLSSHTTQLFYSCNECGVTFPEDCDLREHAADHSRESSRERKHVCNECGKTFYWKCNLNRHAMCHSSDRNYRCLQCGKTFSRKYYLDSHMKKHSGERLFVCNECDSAFTQKGSLERHILNHSGLRPHVCNICNSAFSQKNILISHMRIHSGLRPHICKDCGKMFSRKFILDNHILTHTRNRPHVCNICGRSFRQKSNLKRHIMSHSSERIHRCPECAKTFLHKSYLKKHIRIHYRDFGRRKAGILSPNSQVTS